MLAVGERADLLVTVFSHAHRGQRLLSKRYIIAAIPVEETSVAVTPHEYHITRVYREAAVEKVVLRNVADVIPPLSWCFAQHPYAAASRLNQP